MNPAILSPLLALSAGVLIYPGAVHLLPGILKAKSHANFISLFAGMLLAIILHISRHI